MKTKIILCVITALLVFSSASIWEGSAATAQDGYLPGKGLYAATNSFPRNTVVEIINLENNKSIRVIVAEGLESSGLLALVSLDAAERIGMSRDSISRIRMTQPSDPIAYMRFIDGMAAGIPRYDSGAAVTEDKYRQENQPSVQTPFSALKGLQNGPLTAAESLVPPVFLEEEWADSIKIEDIPENVQEETSYIGTLADDANNFIDIVDATPVVKHTSIIDVEPAIKDATDIEERTTEQKQISVLIAEPVKDATDIEERITEQKQISALIAEPVKDATDIEERITELEQKQVPVLIAEPVKDTTQPEIGKHIELTIVETEERPPETPAIYGIDPDYIIPGISRPKIAEIHPEPINIPDSAPILTPPPSLQSVSPPAPPSAQLFSPPLISRLDKGSFYVQIASLKERDLVESALNRINVEYGDYQPVVFKDEGSWYRILLGPLNQGESGAILRRFKSIGYKDSFIRQGK